MPRSEHPFFNAVYTLMLQPRTTVSTVAPAAARAAVRAARAQHCFK